MRKQNIHGVVLLDKPGGMTSNAALQRVRRSYNARKAGHTGSLDPLATGLLPICLGQATKVSEYLLGSAKRYETVIQLGAVTDTLDAQGEVLEVNHVAISPQTLESALAKFRGEIEQVPPMYSALKKGGQPLYRLARAGQEVEREARRMTVYELEGSLLENDQVALSVHCSSGFYIRSLADDLGRELGCGAHVVQLRRTAIGSITLADAHALEVVEQSAATQEHLLPIDVLLPDMPCLNLTPEQTIDIRHGRSCELANTLATTKVPGLYRLYDENRSLLAIGELAESGQLRSRKLFVLVD